MAGLSATVATSASHRLERPDRAFVTQVRQRAPRGIDRAPLGIVEQGKQERHRAILIVLGQTPHDRYGGGTRPVHVPLGGILHPEVQPARVVQIRQRAEGGVAHPIVLARKVNELRDEIGLAGFVCAGIVFLRMLPGSGAGFVIYNISESRCRRLLADSIGQLGLQGHWQGHLWHGSGGRMTISVRGFALLRNVTVHIESADHHDRTEVDALYAQLDSRLRSISQLPSTMGACLVVLGVGLLIIPMWMVGRNIDALVDAMSRLFG